MPFGFKKPSRSYAGSANAYYDPISGYPTPYDPAPRSSGGGGVTKGYREREDERTPSRSPVDVERKKTVRSGRMLADEQTESAGSSTSSRGVKKPARKNNHVHYEEPTNTPSQLMRPRSGAQAGIVKGKGKGKGRAVQDVSAAMAGFSALDLAPPPPKRKRKMEEEDEEEEEEDREADDWRGDRYERAEVDLDDNERHTERQNQPPNAGFSSGDVSDTEAEAESMLSQDGEEDEEDEEVVSDHREQMAGSSLAGASTGESQHTVQPYVQDEHDTEELVRPSLRIEQYNDHGQLTPPTSDPGHGIPRAVSSVGQGMMTISNAQATSYDAASPWSFHPAPSAHLPALSQPLIQVRPESRSSVHSRTAAAVAAMGERIGSRGRGKDQVSRKYALAPPLYPLAGASVAERYRDQTEMHMRRETSEAEGPATPVQHASLVPPTFALQPPTPQHDLTHTPFHHSPDVESEREQERDQDQDQNGTVPSSPSGYQLPNGLTLGTLIHSRTTAPAPVTSPASKPTSSRSSSHSTKSSHAGQVALNRQGVLQYSAPSSVAHRSASPTPPQSAVGSAASSGTAPPAPINPNQPAFLKWDPSNQRWIPVPTLANTMPPPLQHPMRPESVMSSVSAYSQMSAVRPVQQQTPSASGLMSLNQARRQSLPTLALSPAKSIRRAQSPAMSSLSRPASPSMGLVLASPITGSGFSSVAGFNGRRMSIDPPYLMNANTLTLLPEMHEAEMPPAETQLSPRSAPHSRAPSIDGRASAAGGYGYRSSSSSFRPRNSTVFPAGYDVNARAVEMTKGGSGSRTSSVYGDYMSEGEHGWQEQYGTSRATSIHEDDIPYEESGYDAQSQTGGSAYVGAPAPSIAGTQSASGMKRRDSVKPGRETALDVMSVRGDSVQIHGLDGTEQPAGGYSSLVLPTGAYVPSDPSKATDRLDHRLLGMPHSTMSTITVSDSAGPSGRRSSLGGLRHHREAPTPAHLLADMPAPVTFSSHQAPPTKISASQVLVQVHAVALDKFDSDMVKEKAASGSGAGKWVPGRSFVGRALDVGADVRMIMKGDIVMGLLDIRKSGCLAEYIVCDRRRLARIPLGVNLSLEEVACLPMLGVTAHRACIGQTRGSRALILNAHEGVGALAAQELSSMGLHVIAHVPLDIPNAEDDAWENGAKDVIADDAVAMINAQHESGFEFVLDTIGGRRIYDACRRVLRSNGVFVTMFGDDAEHVPSAPQVKSSMHALRRAFIKKDKKAVSYVHLLPGGAEIDVSGQDTRDILELPVMALYRPKVSMVVPFERAPEAFEELASLVSGRPREDPGSVVVRLSN